MAQEKSITISFKGITQPTLIVCATLLIIYFAGPARDNESQHQALAPDINDGIIELEMPESESAVANLVSPNLSKPPLTTPVSEEHGEQYNSQVKAAEMTKDLSSAERARIFEKLATIAFVDKPEPSVDTGKSIIVFTDYTCPVCQDFHPYYDDILRAGYTIYSLPVARKGINSNVNKIMSRMYCQDDFKSLYNLALQGHVPHLDNMEPCDNDADLAAVSYRAIFALMDKPATPAIWIKGEGIVGPSDLLKRLNIV
ncbi:thioredoxin domain-containing protein [Idiomarina abyssalis]|uniref:Thioredoxin domain-containing protein n=1 Tax=Idiomarina abyssalis TaxID=86102 RepID=A0A8I1GDM5_9GAMM|nr:hypothetical protein [Idiomarina abyssalis]MBJ7265484.1 hypothetical protein [Idiomarina abyssalis]MBJ7316842.1 hypothetical protein [Idiomarina abyssalis]